MATYPRYHHKYDNSWALVIGIDAYTKASPLNHACNDASEVAKRLVENFSFAASHLTILRDADATLGSIRAVIAMLARETAENDRLLIFYAGHGHTVPGNRRDAGFLVPVDGNADDTSTLLPWDELVSSGNVIRAKHILYIMDACYGGMIAMRRLSPGSVRIARDMLSRYSRQYLTAGKADELVADGGGPRRGHSIFTGHLLEAMDGGVTSSEGIITANSLMAYVYDRVAKDHHSRQTPHYGWLDGVGDFFLTDPGLDQDTAKPTEANNLLIEVPADIDAPDDLAAAAPLLEKVKVCLSDRKYRIQLNDLVMGELRAVQKRLGVEHFPLQADASSSDAIAERLHAYEDATSDVLRTAALIGRWADEAQQSVVRQFANILAGQIDAMQSGLIVWLGLRSYPMLLAMYVVGIAAIEGDNYGSLNTLLNTRVQDRLEHKLKTAMEATVSSMVEVERTDAFKMIPGLENKYTPRSEYLFARVQPVVEDILFLGTRYEQLFDRFEILLALTYVDLVGGAWGPIGRFGWKRLRPVDDPFKHLLEEAKPQGDQWAPLRAGMFRGSYARFVDVAEKFRTNTLERLGWH